LPANGGIRKFDRQLVRVVEIAGLIVFVGILAGGLLAAAYYALYSL